MHENGDSPGDIKEELLLKKPNHSSFEQNALSPITALDRKDNKGLQIMQKMGYIYGSGLGKDQQGITEAIKVNNNLGTRGLGLNINGLNLSEEPWDNSQEDIIVQEKVQWLENTNNIHLNEESFQKWMKEDPPDENIAGNWTFCDKEVLENVFKAKDIFDELDIVELNQARARANPFETIRSVFFMNRAALKMANIDAVCDFMFTSMEQNKNFGPIDGPIYFADVCAGPGGFTEYILWRKQWWYKGFGLTLKGENDFKVAGSSCASSVPFQALYGKDKQGDVCNTENLDDFTERVKNETEGKGLHFMMSDGGFCVDGRENLQEVLSKNIYLCQCLLALKILRPHGCFVTKMFDIFTPFSVGLLFLMYLCFKKVGIIKPNSSRPANSERYFVCNDFKVNLRTNAIREYLGKIAMRLREIKNLPDWDVLEIVPLEVLSADQDFFQYIKKSNNSIGKKQIVALKKLGHFCRNPSLLEKRQPILRKECLEYWRIADERRKIPELYMADDVLKEVKWAEDIFKAPPRLIDCRKKLPSIIGDIRHWHYTYLSRPYGANFYAGVGFSKVYRLQNDTRMKVKNLELVKGTLLYGELVKETSVLENDKYGTRCSLHVIDAIRLGSMDLQERTFQERIELIKIFCKSVNKESQTKSSIRVRPKIMKKLSDLPKDPIFSYKNRDENYCSVLLPKIGYKSIEEKCDVNSVLLLKTDDSMNIQSTFLSKVQIFDAKAKDQTDIPSVSFDDLNRTVYSLLASNACKK